MSEQNEGNGTEFMSEFSNMEETIVVARNRFPERPITWTLTRFVGVYEGSEEWRCV